MEILLTVFYYQVWTYILVNKKMAFDKKLFRSNLDGIAETEFEEEDHIKLMSALAASGEFQIAALLAFSQSLRLQLIDLNGNYTVILEENE